MTLLNKEQLDRLKSVLITLSVDQLIWVSGYLHGLIHIKQSKVVINKPSVELFPHPTVHLTDKIHLISASQTGNAHRLSEKLRDDFLKKGVDAILIKAGDYQFKKFAEIKFLIFITSTYGEGEPPEEAVALYRYLFSHKASKMEATYFAVFSFGDRSYMHFAKAGKDFDKRFEELGAHRLCERVDVDLDYQEIAVDWRKRVVNRFISKLNMNHSILNTQNIHQRDLSIKNVVYCKKFPFFACLLNRQKITSRNSIKQVFHLEIGITGSNIYYQPGDSLGVWYENDPNLVKELLELSGLSGHELVEVKGKSILLNESLKKHYELTQNTAVVVKNIAIISKNKFLLDLCNDQKQLYVFVKNTPIVDVIRQISIKLTPQDLLKILRPIQPRFYSISSAQSEVGEEIHITVSAIRYKINGRCRSGGASSYLVDRVLENDKIRIFVESNNNFRLPKNSDISIIMIGAGTGIAPFRAFVQKRSCDKALGKNWLFFGNLKFTADFLYQTEWQYYVKTGLLNNIDTAWSRDQKHKIYVQDKLLKNSVEIWNWIQDGAYIYVCGDAKYMAYDVEQALIAITSKHGGMNVEQATDFWNEMRIQHRYQRDIY